MKQPLLSMAKFATVWVALVIVATDVHAASDRLDAGIRLRPLASHVYKTRDSGNERTESGVFWLLVETTTPRKLTVRSASVQLVSGKKTVQTTNYDAESISAMTIVPPFFPTPP